MKFLFLFLYLFIFSCGYPDIDTVPSFKNLKITKDELIDLCKLNNIDNNRINECLKNLSIQDK